MWHMAEVRDGKRKKLKTARTAKTEEKASPYPISLVYTARGGQASRGRRTAPSRNHRFNQNCTRREGGNCFRSGTQIEQSRSPAKEVFRFFGEHS